MAAHIVELVVRGPLWPDLLAALDDFSVEADAGGLTTIVGKVADQSQLVGLLHMFGRLNIEIVSMNPRSTDVTDARDTA